MDVVVVVLASIILIVAWAAFWALRLWRQWRSLWSATLELLAVVEALQDAISSIGTEPSEAVVGRADRLPARSR